MWWFISIWFSVDIHDISVYYAVSYVLFLLLRSEYSCSKSKWADNIKIFFACYTFSASFVSTIWNQRYNIIFRSKFHFILPIMSKDQDKWEKKDTYLLDREDQRFRAGYTFSIAIYQLLKTLEKVTRRESHKNSNYLFSAFHKIAFLNLYHLLTNELLTFSNLLVPKPNTLLAPIITGR